MRSFSHSRSTARARRSSPTAHRRQGASRPRLGRSQRERAGRPGGRGRCASSTTMPAAGASTTRRTTGRRSGTAARRTTVRSSRTSSRPARRPTEPTGRMQSWQRRQPLLGFDPWLPEQTAVRAPPLALEQRARQDRGLHPLDVRRLSGRASSGASRYLGQPIFGFGSTGEGNPHDRYGRNVYIDTFNSAYGPGWKRESGILVHKPNGTFCHSFVPQKPFPGYPSQAMRPAAPGERYRITVMGPGVTPVIQWEGPGLTSADRAAAAIDHRGVRRGHGRRCPLRRRALSRR